MTAVSKTTLESAPFNTVFDIVKDNVTDPRSSISRTFVYDSDPFHKGLNFGLFPYIIVQMPTLLNPTDHLNAEKRSFEWTQTIIVRTAEYGAGGSRNGQGRSDMLTIGDSLQDTFHNHSVLQTMYDNGLWRPFLEKTDQDTIIIKQKDVYESTYELTYMSRLATA